MEEVWKEINLPSLYTPTAFRGVVLQDFLARPFSKDPTTRFPPVGYESSPPAAAGTSPLLKLNPDPDPNHRGPVSNVGPLRTPAFFDDGLLGDNNGGMKRLPEKGRRSGGGERRDKRMIKNRESAARSRARKQAYTNELELEVERLKRENTRLKKQQLQLNEEAVAAADHFPKKSTLQRTSSAPF